MKIPVKRCTLCGALVSERDVELHQDFHKQTPRTPKRTTVVNSCGKCGEVFPSSMSPMQVLNHVCDPQQGDDCVPEDERRSTENRAGGRAILFEQESRRPAYLSKTFRDQLSGMRMVCSVINCGFEYESSGSGVAPTHKNSWTHVCTGSGVVGAPVIVLERDVPGAVPPVFDGAYGRLPHRAVPSTLPKRRGGGNDGRSRVVSFTCLCGERVVPMDGVLTCGNCGMSVPAS